MSGEDDERCLVSEVSNWAIWFDTVMGKDEVAPLSTSDSSAVAPLSREHRRRTEVQFGVGCKADKRLCMNCSSSSNRRRVPGFLWPPGLGPCLRLGLHRPEGRREWEASGIGHLIGTAYSGLRNVPPACGRNSVRRDFACVRPNSCPGAVDVLTEGSKHRGAATAECWGKIVM